jgi:hypothetical protein
MAGSAGNMAADQVSAQGGLLSYRKVERQVKFLIKNLADLFLFPSKQFLLILQKNQLLQYLNHEY